MMKPRVFPSVVVLALGALTACNRAQTDRDAERAAQQVKTVAAQAGDTLADSWLTTKIQAQFFVDDDIKARYINVSSRDGVVKLKGFVENDDVRRQVLEITRNTDGVKQLDDRELLVGRPPSESFETTSVPSPPAPVATTGVSSASGAGQPDDMTVTSLVQAKYFLDPVIKTRRIEVQTSNGVVTLHGEVADENERAKALDLARATQGVQRVEDSLTVNVSVDNPAAQSSPPVQSSTLAPAAPGAVDTPHADASIEKTLEAKLAADTATKMAKIDVVERQGVVTLQGTAPTPAAKTRALTIAREMNGVTQVIDRITVAPKG